MSARVDGRFLSLICAGADVTARYEAAYFKMESLYCDKLKMGSNCLFFRIIAKKVRKN